MSFLLPAHECAYLPAPVVTDFLPTRCPRRWRALAGSVLFFWGAVVAPAVHLSAHAFAVVDPESVDVEALRDAAGRVDLDALATALGLGEHDESKPHRHGPGPEHHHGEGSLEHFMLALAGAQPVLATPVLLPLVLPVVSSGSEVTRTVALECLRSQRAQAPPTA